MKIQNRALPKEVKADQTIRVQVSPYGEFEQTADDGKRIVQKCDEDAFNQIVANWEADGSPDVLVDFDHTSENGGSTEAAAWLTNFAVEDDGLMADMRMTDKGADALSRSRYRYPSPCWFVGENDGRPYKILSVGLTNKPNLPAMKLLNAQAENVEDAHGHEHGDDGRFTSKGGGGTGAKKDDKKTETSGGERDYDDAAVKMERQIGGIVSKPFKTKQQANLALQDLGGDISAQMLGEEFRGYVAPGSRHVTLGKLDGYTDRGKKKALIDDMDKSYAMLSREIDATRHDVMTKGKDAKAVQSIMKQHESALKTHAMSFAASAIDMKHFLSKKTANTDGAHGNKHGGDDKQIENAVDDGTNQEKGTNNMDKLREMLGLAAEATDEEVLAAVDALRSERDALRSEKEQMEAAAKEAALENEAEEFVEEKKELIEDKEACKNAYKRDPEGTRALFNAIRLPVKPAKPANGKPARVIDVNAAQKPAGADLLANCKNGAEEIAWALRNAKNAVL